MDGYILCTAKGKKETGYKPGEELDMSQPIPIGEKKMFVIYLKPADDAAAAEGASPPPSPKSPKKAAKKGGKKPGAKPGGKAATKPSAKPSPPPHPGGKAPAAPPSPKSPKKADDSPPGTPTKKKKPPKKPPAEPAEEASPAASAAAAAPPPAVPPPEQSFLPPPSYPGANFGLPQSPLIPAPPHRHPYQPYEMSPRKMEIRRNLVEFYMKHNPAKVSEVDDILKVYEGEEDLLMQKLTEKYEAPQASALSAAFASAASPPPSVVINTPARHTTTTDPRILALATEQETKLRKEEERMNMEVKTKLDSALRELQEARRKESLEKEDRMNRERREREEREAAIKRDMDRSLGERKALESLIRDREAEQRRREDDIERRDQDLRRRQEEILSEKELLLRRELDSIDRYEADEAMLRDRTEKMLSHIDPYASSAHHSSSSLAMPKVSEVVTSIQEETTQLKTELRELHSQMRRSSADQSNVLPSPGTQPATPHSPSPEESVREKADPEFLPVFDVLTKAGLQKYGSLFAAHQFNMAAFKRLRDEDLQELGITAVGARKRILAEAEKQSIASSVMASVGNLQQLHQHVSEQQHPIHNITPIPPLHAYVASPPPPRVHSAQPAKPAQPSSPKKLPLQVATATISSPFLPPESQSVIVGRNSAPQAYAEQQAQQSRMATISTKLDDMYGLLRSGTPDRSPERETTHYPTMTSPGPTSPIKISYKEQEWHHGVLIRFYEQIDPIKVAQVDQIVSHYCTVPLLEELYPALASMYHLEPSPYASKVREVCETHHPYRAPATEILCYLSKEREAELIERQINEAGDAKAALMQSISMRSVRFEQSHADEWRGLQEWTENEDPESGRCYYYSEVAKESQWGKPQVLKRRDEYLAGDIHEISKTAPSDAQLHYSSNPPIGVPAPRNPTPNESATYTAQKQALRSQRHQYYRAWMFAFLEKYAPERLGEVEDLLRQFSGKEDVMVERLLFKYAKKK